MKKVVCARVGPVIPDFAASSLSRRRLQTPKRTLPGDLDLARIRALNADGTWHDESGNHHPRETFWRFLEEAPEAFAIVYHNLELEHVPGPRARLKAPRELKPAGSRVCFSLSDWIGDVNPEFPSDPKVRISLCRSFLEACKDLRIEPGGNPGGFWGQVTSRNIKSVERAIRWVTDADWNHSNYQPRGHCEAFSMVEDGGALLHLDFNSMYAWALTAERYTNPKNTRILSRAHGDQLMEDIVDLASTGIIDNGLFDVTMTLRKGPFADFISKHHPFKQPNGGFSRPFVWTRGLAVRTLLHACEMPFWARHATIRLEQCLFSEDSIEHPLKRKAENFLDLREQHRGSQITERILKMLLVSLHGQPTSFTNVPAPYYQEELNGSYFSHPKWAVRKRTGWQTRSPHPSAVYGLGSNIVARCKREMCELSLLAHLHEARVASVNIDGIQVAFPTKAKRKKFVDWLNSNGLLGTAPGQLKFKFGSKAFWAGPNAWAMLDESGTVVESAGHIHGETEKVEWRFGRVSPSTGKLEKFEYKLLDSSQKDCGIRIGKKGWRFIRPLPSDPCIQQSIDDNLLVRIRKRVGLA